MFYKYEDNNEIERRGRIKLYSVTSNKIECQIETDGWTFYVIVGKYTYGNYLCIPNWNIGSELSELKDIFWNEERLKNYTELNPDDIRAIIKGIAELDRNIRNKNGKCG